MRRPPEKQKKNPKNKLRFQTQYQIGTIHFAEHPNPRSTLACHCVQFPFRATLALPHNFQNTNNQKLLDRSLSSLSLSLLLTNILIYIFFIIVSVTLKTLIFALLAFSLSLSLHLFPKFLTLAFSLLSLMDTAREGKPYDAVSGEGLGTGGKFRKRPFRRAANTTPYNRPPTALRNPSIVNHNNNGNGWLSRLVDPAQRLIASSAHRLFSSVFRKRLPPPAPQKPPESPSTSGWSSWFSFSLFSRAISRCWLWKWLGFNVPFLFLVEI
jgi:hypothetical protein